MSELDKFYVARAIRTEDGIQRYAGKIMETDDKEAALTALKEKYPRAEFSNFELLAWKGRP